MVYVTRKLKGVQTAKDTLVEFLYLVILNLLPSYIFLISFHNNHRVIPWADIHFCILSLKVLQHQLFKCLQLFFCYGPLLLPYRSVWQPFWGQGSWYVSSAPFINLQTQSLWGPVFGQLAQLVIFLYHPFQYLPLNSYHITSISVFAVFGFAELLIIVKYHFPHTFMGMSAT